MTIKIHNIKYGGFWRRVMAYQLDSLLSCFIAVVAVGWTMYLTGMDNSALRAWFEREPLWAFILLTIPFLIYFAGFHASKWQATPGMKFLNLRIVNKDFHRLSMLQASWRFIASIVTCLVTWFAMIVHPRKRALHDLMAKTYIVRK